MKMKRYVIERSIPGVGKLNGEQLKGAAATSNEALAKLPGKVQWEHSYVVDDKTFCIYLAENEAAVKDHSQLSGFPANKITEVQTIIDPMTAYR
jgi:Nickel responsive protein SCO4226-like